VVLGSVSLNGGRVSIRMDAKGVDYSMDLSGDLVCSWKYE
jgi:hypothetical protein